MLSLPFLSSKEKKKQKNNTVFKIKEINTNFNKSNIIEDRLSYLYKFRQIMYTQVLINLKMLYMMFFMADLQKTLILSDFNTLPPEPQL